MGLDVREASLIKEKSESRRFAERESASDGLGQTWHMSRYDYVDLVVIRALDHGIHRDGNATAGAKHATKLGEGAHRVRKEHQPEIPQYYVETAIRERKSLPILHRDESIRRCSQML